jgi:tripartite ATP-independent transporter DctM subunit
MEWNMLGMGGVVITVVLVALGCPIGFAFLIGGFIGIVTIKGFGAAFAFLGDRFFSVNITYELSVVSLFILMGNLSYSGGLTQSLMHSARLWVGHMKGGLLLSTTIANAIFGAACGSTTAATAVFGRVAIPIMLENKVDRSFAAGAVAAGGTLSALIPPSVLVVIYGILAKTSIAKLLIATILPGLLTVFGYMVMIIIRTHINPTLSPSMPKASMKERIVSTKAIGGILALFILVIGGIFLGLFTPTEGGAIGAAGAMMLLVSNKEFKGKIFIDAIVGTAHSSAMLFIIITGTYVFSSYISLAGVTSAISQFVVELPVPAVVLVIGILFLYVFLGCVLDPMSMFFLTVPIIIPPLTKLGVDPIWFGVLAVKMACIGMITPPVGLDCFMLSSIRKDISLEEVFRGVSWFILAEVCVMIVLVTFPEISLWLPRLMFK